MLEIVETENEPDHASLPELIIWYKAPFDKEIIQHNYLELSD